MVGVCSTNNYKLFVQVSSSRRNVLACIACIVVGSLFYFDYFVSSLPKSYTFCLSELTMYEF